MSATTGRDRPTTAYPEAQQRLERLARDLQVPQRSLQLGEAKELTMAERAVLTGTDPRRLDVALTLSPSYPRQGGNALEFHSPLYVETAAVNPWLPNQPTTGFALFSSHYWQYAPPAVEIEFDLIEPTKKHLVELYISPVHLSGTWTFDVLPYPVGQTKSLSFGHATTVITEVIDPDPNLLGKHIVTFRQTNEKTENQNWYFQRVVVTVAG